jgi:HK97 family phage portal protein
VDFATFTADTAGLHAAPAPPRAEARELTIGDTRLEAQLFGRGARSSPRVTPESALRHIPVYSAVNRLATDLSVLPLNVYRRRAGGGRDTLSAHLANRLLNLSPDGEMTAMGFRQALFGHVLTCDRGGFAEIDWTRDGQLGALYLLDPRTTRPERTPQSKKLYYRIDNGKSLPPYKVLHVAGLGFNGLEQYSPILLGSAGIGLGIAAEMFGSSFFGNAARPSGALKHPGTLSDAARKRLRDGWEFRHGGEENVGRTAILEEGMDWTPFTVPPEEGQYDQTRRYQRTEVAALYSMPPHKIGDFSEAHLANIEAANLDYLMTALVGWMRAMESACNLKLFRRDEQDSGCYVKHNANALLRGNIKDRGLFYQQGITNGWFTVNDVLEWEDLNPIPADRGGERRFVPANLMPLDGAPAAPESPTTAPPDPGANGRAQDHAGQLLGAREILEALQERAGLNGEAR